jgi:uncharacterized membrane protein YeaQ/YmgE (transglycosylase-associated protein family)
MSPFGGVPDVKYRARRRKALSESTTGISLPACPATLIGNTAGESVSAGSDQGKRGASLSQGGSMGIIAFIILGLLAGAIAKAIMPGDDPGGFIVTAIIGIVGALLGGFVAAALFDAHPLDEFFDVSTWLTAIVGAIVLLVIYRLVVDRGGHGRTLRT